MIEFLLLIPLVFLLIFCFYILIRNNATKEMLLGCISQWRKFIDDDKKFEEVKRIVLRYNYNDILYSFRSINSFKKELNSDIDLVRNSKQNQKRGLDAK